jgi:RIO kinase 1
MITVDFFRKRGIVTMTIRELFEFITDFDLEEDKLDDFLDKVEH